MRWKYLHFIGVSYKLSHPRWNPLSFRPMPRGFQQASGWVDRCAMARCSTGSCLRQRPEAARRSKKPEALGFLGKLRGSHTFGHSGLSCQEWTGTWIVRGFWKFPRTKPPLKVTSVEVVVICPWWFWEEKKPFPKTNHDNGKPTIFRCKLAISFREGYP